MVDLCDLFTNILQAYSSGIGAALSVPEGHMVYTKMPSYQYTNIHCGNKIIFKQSHLHNGVSYTNNHNVTQKYEHCA